MVSDAGSCLPAATSAANRTTVVVIFAAVAAAVAVVADADAVAIAAIVPAFNKSPCRSVVDAWPAASVDDFCRFQSPKRVQAFFHLH